MWRATRDGRSGRAHLREASGCTPGSPAGPHRLTVAFVALRPGARRGPVDVVARASDALPAMWSAAVALLGSGLLASPPPALFTVAGAESGVMPACWSGETCQGATQRRLTGRCLT